VAEVEGAVHWGSGEFTDLTLGADGERRSYCLYRPEAVQAAPRVVVVLHGYGGSAADSRMYGMEAVADREGFVLAYAQAPGGEWNIGHQYRNTDPAVQRRDDLAYLDALIADLPRVLEAPVRAVGLLGVSLGGVMAISHAAATRHHIGAIASVISGMTNRQWPACRTTASVPYMLVIGTKDRLLPPDNGQEFAVAGQDGQPLWLLPYEQTLTHWAASQGCIEPRLVSLVPDSAEGGISLVTRHAWLRNGREHVVGCRIHGMGHRWPGMLMHPRERTDPSLTSRLGPACGQVNGAELVWRFLEPHLLQR
jgi:polyhydroxybutyrate depolymerase